MKLKKIIAGITAFAIVGSTMLAMPVSARTTTKAEDVGLSDLLNMAKMAVELKDDIKLEKQAELLDKFDTNGNGKISINEVLVVAQKIARTDESDIVNEYGTADETTTTEETSETTLETTETTTEETSETTLETTETTEETSETTLETTITEETSETTLETTETTTEETTTTTEIIEFNPVIEIDGKEYNDGDKFIAEADGIYKVNVTDSENKITVSLTGSQDENGNSLIEVYETRFKVKADGELTITVTTADGQEKTITLNVAIAKNLKDVGEGNLYVKYINGEEIYYSEKYKNFSNEIGYDKFNAVTIEDTETYWDEAYKKHEIPAIKINNTIRMQIGGKAKITGFTKRNNLLPNGYEDYDTNDEIKFISSDSNKATVDENGVITGIEATEKPIEIIVIANGEEVSRFNVTVINAKCEKIETSGEMYAGYYSNYKYNYYDYIFYYFYYHIYLTEGKYVENVSSGEALSLKDLQNQVGAENVKSVSVKNFDETKKEIKEIQDAKNIIYYLDKTNSTVYYAITDKSGEGGFYINNIEIKVLDMEQYKKYEEQQGKETFSVEFYGEEVATATKSGINYKFGGSPTIFMTEGETFTLSDIAKVSDVDDPNIKVKNSKEGTSAQNLAYDPLTKTFTVLELTEENSGTNNGEKITLTYETSDGETREIEFEVEVVKPAFSRQIINQKDTGKIYSTPEQIDSQLNIAPLYISSYYNNLSGYYGINNFRCIFDNTEMLKKTTEITQNSTKDVLSLADNYTPKVGDTVTIITIASRNGRAIYSPNIKVTYTIEIVDELPQISQNPLKEAVFEYPADNKGNQTITFENIIKAENIPGDWQIVPRIESASENVCYIDYYNNEVTPTDMTVDTRNIKVVKGTNGYYSISGIEVASAPKVDPDTYMYVRFAILDKDGNLVTQAYVQINLSIKGEKPLS